MAKRFIFTKEPGTWVMFLTAYITGFIKGGRASWLPVIVFISLSLLLMAKAPVSVFLKRREQDALYSAGFLLLPAFLGCLYSAVKQPLLIFFYAVGTVLLISYFVFLAKGFPVVSEGCGMAVMGLAAGVAAAAEGETALALCLSGMFFSFYLASSFRVRFSIPGYRITSGAYSGGVLIAAGIIASTGKPIFLSFLPLLEDVYSSFRGRKESFKRLGILSTLKTVAFAMLLVVL